MISPGTRLGPYEIVSKIGAGGMGEVWRANDTRLDRAVAIKVLPAEFSADAQLRVRFEREAKTISQLNHPNICTLYDVGDNYLVMELIEGECLAERLTRGPLPLPDVLRYGAQVADALDRAHRAGIVHRDVKPANVIITRSGAKLLDFGLARNGGISMDLDGATAHKPLTREGTILGTFQYMAPEQLEGADADARTDIFALGALLYEMTTGKRAFEARTKTSLIAAIVSSEPAPISSVSSVAVAALDHVIGKCLRKDPDDRWQTARDVASELAWIGAAGSQAGSSPAAISSRRQKHRFLTAAAALGWIALAAVLAWTAIEWRRWEPARRPLRADIDPRPDAPFSDLSNGAAAISPDGKRLLTVVVRNKVKSLAIRDLAGGTTTLLESTEGASFPFWSPDSSWIGFFSDGALKKVHADGGPVQTLCEAHAGRGGTWGRSGDIVFAPDITSPLMKVSSEGGTPVAVTKLAGSSWTHRNPWFLPDGKTFLFTAKDGDRAIVGAIYIGSVDGAPIHLLTPNGSNPQFARGWLFFVRDRNLVAQRLDPGSQELTGALIPIAQSVDYYNPRDLANFSVSAAGVLAWRQSFPQKTQLAWYDGNGREIGTVGEAALFPTALGGSFGGARASGDGRFVSLVRMDASGTAVDIWMMDLARGQVTRATSANYRQVSAVPSYDGSELAMSSFSSARRANGAFWTQPSSGGRTNRQEQNVGNAFVINDWSRDEKLVIASVQAPGTGFDLLYGPADDMTKMKTLLGTQFDERDGRLSPDGRWLAYRSNETGDDEVYVTDFPAVRRKWQVSRSGGGGPVWSSDGRTLFYHRDADNGFVVERVALDIRNDVLEARPPQPLPTPPDAALVIATGDRFLLLRKASADIPEPIRLLQNWESTLAGR